MAERPTGTSRSESGARKAIRLGSETIGNVVASGAVLAFIFGIFHHSIGLHYALPVPFTNAHISWAGAAGDPSHLTQTFPGYIKDHMNNLADGTSSISGWHWGFMGVDSAGAIGKQAGAPGIDFGINFG